MSKAYLATVAALVLVVRWLAQAHLPMLVGGTVISVPALALAALALMLAAAAAAGLVALRVQHERAAWQAGRAGAS